MEMTDGEHAAPVLSETAVKTSSSDSEVSKDSKLQPSSDALDVGEIEVTLAVADSTDSESVK